MIAKRKKTLSQYHVGSSAELIVKQSFKRHPSDRSVLIVA